MYKDDETKTFIHSSEYHGQTADLALSLDVVYHLIEDDVFERYMRDLFASAKRFVIVYSSNFEQSPDVKPSHVRHRKFTDWVSDNCKNARLIETIPNRYPHNEQSPDDTSFADFFVYEIVFFKVCISNVSICPRNCLIYHRAVKSKIISCMNTTMQNNRFP